MAQTAAVQGNKWWSWRKKSVQRGVWQTDDVVFFDE